MVPGAGIGATEAASFTEKGEIKFQVSKCKP